MTKDEHIEMVKVGAMFWRDFSLLCNRYINEAPEHLRSEYKMYLGEKTSIYGIGREGKPE